MHNETHLMSDAVPAEKPDKILIFSEDFPPYSGGIAQWAAGIARGLHDAGYEVDVLTRFRDEIASYFDRSLPFMVRFITGKNWKKFRTYYCRKALQEYFSSFGTPALIIATTWNFARAVIPFRRGQKTALITVVHGLEVTRKLSALKKWWLQYTLKNSSLIISVSDFTRQRVLDRFKIEPSKIVRIANGVNLKKFHPDGDIGSMRERYGIDEEKVILTLARVIERKGHDRVLRALPRVLEHFPETKYIICGPWEENYYARLQRLMSELRLRNKVIFTGYVPPNELNQIYNLCDVYVMPSRELVEKGDAEGFGITYLEANACEKPVIGGLSGGVADAIVDGETGFLVDPNDVDALADRLIKLLGNKELARRMGRAGRERVEREFTWDAIAQQLMEAYYLRVANKTAHTPANEED